MHAVTHIRQSDIVYYNRVSVDVICELGTSAAVYFRADFAIWFTQRIYYIGTVAAGHFQCKLPPPPFTAYILCK